MSSYNFDASDQGPPDAPVHGGAGSRLFAAKKDRSLESLVLEGWLFDKFKVRFKLNHANLRLPGLIYPP